MDNGKISLRQMKRLLFFDVIGIGLLVLPEREAELGGELGALLILTGGFVMSLYLLLLSKVLERQVELWKLGYVVYGIYLLFASGYGLFLLSNLVHKFLLPGQSLAVIVGMVLLLVFYSGRGGIEAQSRVYEVLFWPLMLLLVMMLLFGARSVEWHNLLPREGIEGRWLTGGYVGFLAAASGQLMYFMPGHIESGATPQKERRAAAGAVIGASLVLAIIYEMLLGSFGRNALASARGALMIFSSNIVMPGGFLRRQEALIAGVCFVALLAFISSGFCYGTLCLKKIKDTKWIDYVAFALLFFIALGQFGLRERASWVLVVATPFVMCIPFLGLLFRKKKSLAIMFLIVALAIPMVGCSVQELENRNFPMYMCLGIEDGQCALEYGFADFNAVSKENMGQQTVKAVEAKGDSIRAAAEVMDENSGKILDLNHVKVLLLEEDFLADNRLVQELVEMGNEGTNIPGNALLFVTKDLDELHHIEKDLGEDMGSYLESYLEGRPEYAPSKCATLKNLVCDWYNDYGATKLPYLEVRDEMPIISQYCYLKSEAGGAGFQVEKEK